MLCSRPFRVGVAEFGCGQCMPCRINRKRLWTLRLMLEATQHKASFFVTLTYDEKHVPSDGSVNPDHLQAFMKLLRYYIHPRTVRFYGVGEYGERRGRPHYHVLLFCSDVVYHEEIAKAWKYQGLIHVGQMSLNSAAYCASYTTKRMTKSDDPRLAGKHPEFARMSLRPHGIGAGAMPSVADTVLTKTGALYVVRNGDVPGVLRWDGRVWSLGRYLRKKLRDECGYEQPIACFSYEEKLRELQSTLRTVNARAKRESVRVQHGRIADKRESIARSKRGNEL